MEKRSWLSKIELRQVGGRTQLRGFAARYGALSADLGGFREVLAHGAFTNALRRGDDVRMLRNHNADQILGRTKSGTLRLMEKCSGPSHEMCGLFFECDLPDTSVARDLAASVQRGDTDGCSFSFSCDDDSFDNATDENGLSFVRRTVRDVHLFDVSAVTYPAYPSGTSITAESVPFSSIEDLELNSIPESVLVEARRRGGSVVAPRPAKPSQPLYTPEEREELRRKREAREAQERYQKEVDKSNKVGQKTPFGWQRES